MLFRHIHFNCTDIKLLQNFQEEIHFLLEAAAHFLTFWYRINKTKEKNKLELVLTNPAVVIDRMVDCLAIYHKNIRCPAPILRQRTMPQARQRSTLREEAFGAIKTLTRLAHTNPSFGTDKMNVYQAMYHEISSAQCISLVMPKKRSI